MIGKWLRAGVLDQGRLSPTERGSPQGGVASPLLMNVALHGMEQAAGVRYITTGANAGTVRPGSPVVIRYADDLLAFCRSRQEAEQVKARLADWLAPRGLVFNEDKTAITCLDEAGVDVLGFTARRYRGKLLITPSKAAVKRIRVRLSAEMRALRGANAEAVLQRFAVPCPPPAPGTVSSCPPPYEGETITLRQEATTGPSGIWSVTEVRADELRLDGRKALGVPLAVDRRTQARLVSVAFPPPYVGGYIGKLGLGQRSSQFVRRSDFLRSASRCFFQIAARVWVPCPRVRSVYGMRIAFPCFTRLISRSSTFNSGGLIRSSAKLIATSGAWIFSKPGPGS